MPNENSELDSNTAAALKAGTALARPSPLGLDGVNAPAFVVPLGYKVAIPEMELLEPFLLKPLRKKGSYAFADVDSFLRYFQEHATPASRIFAKVDDSNIAFEAILDFHAAEPSFHDHLCHVTLRATREWSIWQLNNGKKMTQVEFAAFLELNADLFSAPSGADLLELVQNLEGKSNISVKSAVRLTNGQIKLDYDEEVELKGGTGTQAGQMEIPARLKVSISPFEGTAFYDLDARLRYRVENRKISFWYETVDAHLVVRAIADDAISAITNKTSLIPFKQ